MLLLIQVFIYELYVYYYLWRTKYINIIMKFKEI